MTIRYAGFLVETSRRQVFKATRSTLLLAVLLASTFGQTVSAFDANFYSGNDIFFYNPDACKVEVGGSATLVGKDVPEKIWRFLVDRGLTAEQAAGILGNIQAESGFVVDVVEKSGGGGYGIVQWTGGRRTQLEKAAQEAGTVPSDLAFQLDFLLQELHARKTNSVKNFPRYYQGHANEWEAQKAQKNIEDALVAFHNNFERSHLWDDATSAQNAYDRVIAARLPFAQNAYASFKSITGTGNGGTGEAGGVTKKPVVFLDPGHGAAMPQYIDPKTGLADRETDNGQETKDMLDVANRIKAELDKAGYTVSLARTANEAQVNKRERVDAAAAAKADIAVSLHSDGSPTPLNQVWYQRVGAYREYNGKHVQFENKEVADKSLTYANAMAATRAAAEGNPVTTDPNGATQAGSFGREGIPSKGNISLVQLWSTDVPWVYNEISRDVGNTGLSENRKNAYVKGVVDGIKQAVKPSDSSGCTGSNFEGGNLQQTTLAYAWPNYRGLTVVAKDEWQVASKKARGEGRYIGGIQYPGIDCGGFVTTLLVDSGSEPNYNYGGKLSAGAGATPTQLAWAKANRDYVGKGNEIDVATLQPGDSAHLPGHTFVYVGEISGFESVIASASLDERAPMAGKESLTSSSTVWYRKKATPKSPDGGALEGL